MLSSSRRLAELVEAAAGVVGQSDLRAVLYETVEAGMTMTGARYGALGVIGEHANLAEFLHVGMASELAAQIGPLPTGGGVLGTLIRSAETIRLDRIKDHPDSIGFPEQHPVMDTFLGVPIRLGTRVFGNLYLTEKQGGFTSEDVSLVESLSVVAGAAVSTARLQERLRNIAIVEDRERIARDLHDAIIQDLFAVGLSLQGMTLRVDEGDLRTMLTDAVERLDHSITELRRFIFDLRPPVWTNRNLANELADLVGQLSAPHSAAVALHVPPNLGSIPSETVDCVVHLVREALSNALRHSKANTITVTVDQLQSTLAIIVADDGRGFDVDTVQRGLGLDNLQTRAIEAGGSADIRSRSGSGTTVTFNLPL